MTRAIFINGLHPFDLTSRLEDLLIPTLSVVNLGAGVCGSPISEQLIYLPFEKLYNVEVHEPAVRVLQTLPFESRTVTNIHMDIRDFVGGEWESDVTLLIDVLEHLSPDEGKELLARVRQRTTRRVLIWLPIGPCPQEEYAERPDMPVNPWQVHASTWNAEDFADATHFEYLPNFHRHLNPPAHAAWVWFDK